MKFSYDEMNTCCQEFQKVAENIEDNFANIKGIKQKIDSYWKGEASEQYQKKLTKTITTFDKFSDELNSEYLYLQQVIEEYNKLDRKIISGLSNIFNAKNW